MQKKNARPEPGIPEQTLSGDGNPPPEKDVTYFTLGTYLTAYSG